MLDSQVGMTRQTTMTRTVRRLAQSAEETSKRYSGGSEQPLRGYATTMATYSAVVAALTGAAVASGRDIPAGGLSPYEVLLSAAATHKISLLIARDPVTSPLRAPFTSFEGTSGPAELSEDVRATGEGKVIGEMITCPFCMSVWVATGMTAGLIFVPRMTRLIMGTFAALAGADLLQFAHSWLTKTAS